MITIPTTELIGGIQDMLPIVLNEKSDLAGLAIEWDGESLHFTAYDVFAAATVKWTPGEGAEGDGQIETEGSDDGYEPEWGGDDSPWRTWIYLDAAKEIVKLFKLPAKLWRIPVTLKCTPVGDLLIERVDSPRGNRELRVPGDPDKARRDIPAVSAIRHPLGLGIDGTLATASFFHARLGAFGAARAHGTLCMIYGGASEPVAVAMGKRYAGFIYPTDTKNVRPFNFLRDAGGVVASHG
jgi:hypothetical protein